MKINVSYDPASLNISAAFTAAVNTAVSLLDSLFQNTASLNIVVGWGIVKGQPLAPGTLGQNSTNLVGDTYAATKAAILATDGAWHSDNPALTPFLPTTYPIANATVGIATSEAKALGLIAASSSIDGYVGINSTANWAYNENGTIGSGQYDLVSTIIHEVTEVMGRISDLGVDGFYTAMDLFRYSSTGVLNTAPGGANSTAYFSTDGGATHLGTWNNNPSNGDFGDWYPQGPGVGGYDAANDYATPGHFAPLSQVDLTLMDALGWNTLKQNVRVSDQTTMTAVVAPLKLYADSDPGLNFQYDYHGTDKVNVDALVSNQFVLTGSGDDAINFSQVSGKNVLDGGTGSNFLVGCLDPTSQDTFYIDDRAPQADIWTSVINLHKGDDVTIWGLTPTTGSVAWANNEGAVGYTGLTAHVTSPGHPTASLTLTGLSTADLSNGHLSISYGSVDGIPYLYIHDLL